MGVLTQTTAEVQSLLDGEYSFTDGANAAKDILKITNTDAGKAPFCLSVGDYPFNGANDFWMFFGYNFSNGVVIDATEPSLAWGLESSYNNGTAEYIEYYLQWRSPVGVPWARLFEWAINKETGQLESAAIQAHFLRFRRWEDVGLGTGPLRTFAILSACDEDTAAITFPAFRLMGLGDQTDASTIGASSQNSKQSNLYVSSETRTGYFATVAAGINISETTHGTISFSTDEADCVTISRYGNLILTKRIVQTQLTGALTDGAPTDTEIDTITGLTPATAGAGWQCTIKDNNGTGLLYRIESDGTNWFYTVMTKAV